MSVQRLGTLVVKIAADMLRYKADFADAANATVQGAAKIEQSVSKTEQVVGGLTKTLGGLPGVAGEAAGGLNGAAQAAGALQAAGGAAIGPVLALVAAVGLGVKISLDAQREQQALQNSLIMTGNAAGTSASQMQTMARANAEVAGTQGQNATALAALAATGQVGYGQLQQASMVAVQSQLLLGTTAADTAEQFASLGREPVQASLKFNETMNYLTASTFAQIKAAEDLGDTQAAAAIAQDALAAAQLQRLAQVEQNLGTLQKAWMGLGVEAKRAWDFMLGLGREASPADKIAGLEKDLNNRLERNASLGIKEGAATKELRDQLAVLKDSEKIGDRAALRASDRAASEKAAIGWMQEGDKLLKPRQKMEMEIERIRTQGNRAGREQEEIEKRIAATREKYAEKGKGGGGTAQADREAAKEARELEKAYQAVLKVAQQRANARNAESAGIEAYLRGEEQLRIATVKAANDAVRAAQDEYDQYGLSKSQIAELTLARLNDKLAAVQAGSAIAESIGLQIAAQKELIGILQKGESRDAAVKAAETVAKDAGKFAEDMERGLTDSLFRAAKKGGGFFKTMFEELKNLFKTTALKLAINAVVGGGAGGAGGLASAAQSLLGGGGGGGSNILSSLGNISSSISSLGTVASQVAAGTMSLANAAGTIFANTTGTGLSGLLATNGAFGTAAGGAAGTAGLAASIGTAVAIAAPLAIFALAANEFRRGPRVVLDRGIRGSFDAEGFRGTNYETFEQINGGLRGDNRGTTDSALASGVAQQFTDTMRATRDSVALFAKGIGLSTDVLALYRKTITSGAGQEAIDKIFANMGEEMARSVLTGRTNFSGAFDQEFFIKENLPERAAADAAAAAERDRQIAEVQGRGLSRQDETDALFALREDFARTIERNAEAFNSFFFGNLNGNNLRGVATDNVQVGEDNSRFIREGETASAALLRLGTSLGTVNGVFGSLNLKLLDVSIKSADAASQLVDLFGGIDKFTAASESYYQNYFTEEEKKARLQAALADKFKQFGIAQPTTRAGFRAAVEEARGRIDTPDGRALFAGLLQLESAFAQLVPATTGAGDAVTALTDRMKDLLGIRKGLEADLLEAQGNTSGAQAARRAIDIVDFTAAEIAAYDYNAALRAQIDALTKAKQIAEQRQGLEIQIMELQGNAAGALAARRAIELAALDATLQPLQNVIYGLQDLQTAAAAAAAAANQAADLYFAGVDRGNTITDLTAQGSAALDQIFASTTSASTAAVDGAKAASSAAQKAAQTWAQAASSIKSSLDSIRLQSQQLRPEGKDALFAQFQTATVLARGGDAESAAKLGTLATAYLGLAGEQATSQAQLLTERALIENSLEDTLNVALAGVSVQESIAAATSATAAGLERANVTLTGFAGDLQRVLAAGYSGATRPEAERVSGALATATADFANYFRTTQEGASRAFAGGTLTRLAGDSAQFTGADGRVDFIRAADSILGVSNRIEAIGQAWQQQYGIRLPGFAVGTNYVPQDMIAQIHEGEAIVPRAYNPAANPGMGKSGGQDMSAMLTELRALRTEVMSLQRLQAQGNESSKATAEVLQGRVPQARPLRVEMA